MVRAPATAWQVRQWWAGDFAAPVHRCGTRLEMEFTGHCTKAKCPACYCFWSESSLLGFTDAQTADRFYYQQFPETTLERLVWIIDDGQKYLGRISGSDLNQDRGILQDGRRWEKYNS